jgi:hypothetical protein
MDSLRSVRWAGSGAAVLLAVFAAPWVLFPPPAEENAAPAKRPAVELSPVSAPADAAEEMFAAIDRGELAARLLPEKDQQARLELENRTDRPLTVALPPAFGGRASVLAGVGMPSPQPVGGGMGGGFMSIPPERVGYLRVRTACLDDTKAEPSPGMVYEVCRIEELARQPGVSKLCAMLGDGKTDRRAVQAAVWHLNCDRSWPWLSGRLKSCGGPHGTQRLFSRQQIATARQLAEVAMR